MIPSAESKTPPIDVGVGIVLEQPIDLVGVRVDHRLSTCRFLITKRRTDTVYGGYWELPGGKTESGEGIDPCVEREIREEVGLKIRVIHNLGLVEHTYPHASVRLHPRVCERVEPSAEPRAIEVAETEWVGLADLGRYAFPEANEQVFELFRAWLTQERSTGR